MQVDRDASGRFISGERELPERLLAQRITAAAGGFATLGVGENDAVAIHLRNDFAFFEASLGATALGAYAVPLNWHYQAEEAGYILNDCGAKALVVHADLLGRIAAGIPAGLPVLVVATSPEIAKAYGVDPALCRVPEGRHDWDAWLARQQPWSRSAKALRASMIYTSGTTGRPKGVRRLPPSPEMALAMARMVELVFDIRARGDLRTVITGPLYHSAPNVYGLYAARSGGLVVLQPRFEAEELLALIDRHRISHLHMVPTMFVRLLRLPDAVKRRYDLSSLRWVVHAAAPCPPEVKRRMIEWWGPVINEYYGATETGAVVFHDSREALRKPGTVGRALEGAQIRIHDDAGNLLGPGQVGEIFMRQSLYPDFTYHGLEAKRREVERDGLISVGDVGYVDQDGYLFLCDRARDMVISGGVNIYPAEIEACLLGLPGVRDCAVFGIPDEEFGEALCAHVDGDPALVTGEVVRGYLGQHLARYKVPKAVVFQSDLPREDSGKIFKRKLRDAYWQGAGRRI
ncbi:MAG: AMP-binding protein [Alphaproteobacteria bacterium]|nr:AMP-binding protein [Alphaproteobacteria bacterium]